MAASYHLGFYRTANRPSAIRSADPENHNLEPNTEWIGCTVCEIFAFKLYCDLETGVLGHSRSSKTHYSIAHTTLYSFSVVTMPHLLPFPRYSRILALGLKPSDLRNDPWWRKTRMMGLSDGKKNFDDAFSCFDTNHACETDRQTA